MHPLELALCVVLFHAGRRPGGSRSERRHHVAWRHHDGRNLTPEGFRKDAGHFYAIQNFGREEIVLSGMRCRALGKHRCRNCGKILAADPADPLIPHGPAQLAVREPEGGKDILHEEMRTACLPSRFHASTCSFFRAARTTSMSAGPRSRVEAIPPPVKPLAPSTRIRFFLLPSNISITILR